MSNKIKVAVRICRRANYFMLRNSRRSLEVSKARDFISRCYEMS